MQIKTKWSITFKRVVDKNADCFLNCMAPLQTSDSPSHFLPHSICLSFLSLHVRFSHDHSTMLISKALLTVHRCIYISTTFLKRRPFANDNFTCAWVCWYFLLSLNPNGCSHVLLTLHSEGMFV